MASDKHESFLEHKHDQQPQENPTLPVQLFKELKVSEEVTKKHGVLRFDIADEVSSPEIKQELCKTLPIMVNAINGMDRITANQKLQVEKHISKAHNNNGELSIAEKNEHELLRNNISNQEQNNKTIFHIGNAGIGLAAMGDCFNKNKDKIENESSKKQFATGFGLVQQSLSHIVTSTVETQIENTNTLHKVMEKDESIKKNEEIQQILGSMKMKQVYIIYISSELHYIVDAYTHI